MGLSNQQVGLKLLAKIQIYILTRAELLFTLCSEIPCKSRILMEIVIITEMLKPGAGVGRSDNLL